MKQDKALQNAKQFVSQQEHPRIEFPGNGNPALRVDTKVSVKHALGSLNPPGYPPRNRA